MIVIRKQVSAYGALPQAGMVRPFGATDQGRLEKSEQNSIYQKNRPILSDNFCTTRIFTLPALVAKWQTRTLEVRVEKSMGVRVSPSALFTSFPRDTSHPGQSTGIRRLKSPGGCPEGNIP